jgi:3-methyl-2-oxobutanoate hydroxymethyltransferase
MEDAIALRDAGAFAVVLESIPDDVARMATQSIDVPTIGIGAGRHCDGQVIVFHDLLGFTSGEHAAPKFVRRYASLEETATLAVGRFVADVRDGRYPSSEETYHMTDQMGAVFDSPSEPTAGSNPAEITLGDVSVAPPV